MFSRMEMGEFMESGHSDIFQVELVTKIVVLWSGTYFIHIRVKIQNIKHDPIFN